MGELIRTFDWAATPLGDIENWPQSLWSALSICLSAQFPICIYWGPHYIMLYNDAWKAIPGRRHPWALGRSGPEVWPEMWPTAGPKFDMVLKKGNGIWAEDAPMVMMRFGYAEECFFNYNLSPVHGEGGKIAGVFAVAMDTTYRVLSERRFGLLHELGLLTMGTRSVRAICQSAADLIAANPADIPFCLFYLIDYQASPPVANLAAKCGVIAPQIQACPSRIELNANGEENTVWPLHQAFCSKYIEIVQSLDPSLEGKLSIATWREPVRSAVVIPVPLQSNAPSAILVAGVHPGRGLDHAYLHFFEILAAQLASALSNAHAVDAERQRADKIADIDQAKTSFFSNISHEFRTPLTLILGPLEAILARPTALADTERNQLRLIERNALRLLKLVNTLLDFSRLEAHRYEPHYELVDLATYTAGLAGAFNSVCDRALLTLEIDCPPLPEPVYVDCEMWEKVILNLLSNAFKFTLAGGLSVRLQPSANGKAAVLKVSDTGVGIPEHELPHIFERFHRVKGRPGRSDEGTGIGLALAQELVKLNGGSIEVSSVVGRGSEFTVSIPFGRDHMDERRTESLAAPAAPSKRTQQFVADAQKLLPDEHQVRSSPGQSAAGGDNAKRTRILLAEDNSDMRQYLLELLRAEYDVVAVPNGNDALLALQNDPVAIDLILTDVMMPAMDGYGLLRKVREDPKIRTVPVIMLSARAGDRNTLAGLEAEANDYVVKPFSANELLARVRANIRMARLRKEADEALEKSQSLKAERDRVELLERMVNVQEQERLRIARELHDQTGQNITGLALGLKGLENHIQDARGRETLRWLEHLSSEIGQSLHRAAWELRPTSLDDVGLLRAVETYVRDWADRFGITVDLHGGIDGVRFPAKVETTAYRVVQEAMTNVFKHAGASTVSLVLERRDSQLQIIIEDDGRGFDPTSIKGSEHLGLAGMRERLALIDGTITVDSEIGVGTTLYVRIPILTTESGSQKADV